MVRPSFTFLLDNLPLTLPVLSVAMSIMLRPHELRAVSGWLKLSNAFATGLVSFSIWAFVAGRGVEEFIRINQNRVLDKEYALLLVFCSFIWAGFCSVVTAMAERPPAQSGVEHPRIAIRLLQIVILGISVALLFAPFYLFENKTDVEARLGKALAGVYRRHSV